jgi:hypothetical protein
VLLHLSITSLEFLLHLNATELTVSVCIVVNLQIISQKDDHCWIGELNGLRGWFPAKFVELLDERSKSYSSAGDDSVTETITDIVRGV